MWVILLVCRRQSNSRHKDRDGSGLGRKVIPEELDRQRALLWGLISLDTRLVSNLQTQFYLLMYLSDRALLFVARLRYLFYVWIADFQRMLLMVPTPMRYYVRESLHPHIRYSWYQIMNGDFHFSQDA